MISFFEKSHIHYMLRLKININKSEDTFDYEINYGRGYLDSHQDKPLILEKGNFDNRSKESLPALVPWLSSWEHQITRLFSDRKICVHECSLSVAFENFPTLDWAILKNNISLDDAIGHFTSFREHITDNIVRRRIRKDAESNTCFVPPSQTMVLPMVMSPELISMVDDDDCCRMM